MIWSRYFKSALFVVVFSSNIFLFAFLPFVLLVNFVLPSYLRNTFILCASLFFYTWGSGPVVFLLLLSIIVNYFAALWIEKAQRFCNVFFVLSVIFNLSLLFYFKYFSFFYGEIDRLIFLLANHLGFSYKISELGKIELPIGISFFTFQAISYLGEVRSKEQKAARNIIDYGMYISLFPHLIAGPIVRYSDISKEIQSRSLSTQTFFEGIVRFSLGLGKKVILANSLGVVADKIFALPSDEVMTSVAWIGIVCYSFQIYYDFSGYSDMAIGLARMLGFHFPENFNQPYRAQNITEFWRRWHLTLSRWFRDFVYIPLGGNRYGTVRTYFNLWIVFFLCGLWHGASWTFVFWGLYHGILLVIERILKLNFKFVPSGVLGHLVTLVLIMVGWVFFRADTLGHALAYLSVMFGLRGPANTFTFFGPEFYLQSNIIFFLVLSAVFAVIPVERMRYVSSDALPITFIKACMAFFLLMYSASVLSTSAFNPFIYFRF